MPEKGRLFCERVPFPEANLFLDLERVAYRELSLYEGFGRTFFSRATPKACPSLYQHIIQTHGRVQLGLLSVRRCSKSPSRQACEKKHTSLARKLGYALQSLCNGALTYRRSSLP